VPPPATRSAPAVHCASRTAADLVGLARPLAVLGERDEPLDDQLGVALVQKQAQCANRAAAHRRQKLQRPPDQVDVGPDPGPSQVVLCVWERKQRDSQWAARTSLTSMHASADLKAGVVALAQQLQEAEHTRRQ
jgi:hypothetical protein